MSSSSWKLRGIRQWVGALAISLTLVCGLTPAFAAGAASSPKDRARFVSITLKLEKAPLDPRLQADREWALNWLTEAPDVSVTVCLDTVAMDEKAYPYAPEVVLQYMFSMAAFVIEHPEAAKEPDAQQLAGAEGALNAYRSILKDKPDARSPDFDAMLAAQGRGELPAFVKKASAQCSANP